MGVSHDFWSSSVTVDAGLTLPNACRFPLVLVGWSNDSLTSDIGWSIAPLAQEGKQKA